MFGAIQRPARAYSYTSGATGPSASHAVAIEAPIEIAYGGQPYAVMMGTPDDLEDFAAGFSLTEGVIESFAEIRAIEARPDRDASRINIVLTADRMRGVLARKRVMAGRTGCGLCGVEDLEHLPHPQARAPAAAPSPQEVGAAVAALHDHQPLNALTRAVHAAAWRHADGSLTAREDVGRHNALDKCIGALLRQGVAPDGGFLIVTSRCSFEMVAKAAAFGASTLVTVSAPTSLALQAAEAAGLHLIVTARADRALQFEEQPR